MVRESFSFGAGSENFWNQNEKLLARLFQENTHHDQNIFGPYRRDSSMLSHWLAAPIAIVSMATCRPYALSDEHDSLHRSNSR
nr:hypothetical protein [Porphyromonas gulae]